MENESTHMDEQQLLHMENEPHGQATELDTSFQRVQTLCTTRDWLKQQLLEFKTSLAISSEESSDLNDTENVETNLHRLKREVQNETVNQILKTLMLQRLQEAELLTKLLSTKSGSETNGDTSDRSTQCKRLQELLNTQRILCTDILTHHKATQGIQPEVDKLKTEVQDLKTKIRLLMKELHTLQKDKESHTALSKRNTQIARTQEKLAETKARVAIVMGVFKRLIIGSQVDWVQQDYLCKLILDMDS